MFMTIGTNGLEYVRPDNKVEASFANTKPDAFPIGAVINYFKTGQHEIPGNLIKVDRPIRPAEPKPVTYPLPVFYYSQRDSDDSYQANRMCYSSSNAMVVNFLLPGVLSGTNGDDQYLGRVLRYGDTTSPDAQIQALHYYGRTYKNKALENARFSQQLNWKDIDAQLAKGRPVPIGILFQGYISEPSGGGHWIVVIGKTPDGLGYFIHDPYGELDLVNGYYDTSPNLGPNLIYSKENLGKRWMVNGTPGWGIIV